MDGHWLLVEGRPLLVEEGVRRHQPLLRVLLVHLQTLHTGISVVGKGLKWIQVVYIS